MSTTPKWGEVPDAVKEAGEYWRNMNRAAKGEAMKKAPRTEGNIDLCLAALATCSSPAAASVWLKEQHDMTVPPASLRAIRDTNREQFEELRGKVAQKVEQSHARDLSGGARLATEVAELALEQGLSKLEREEYADPIKAAREVSDIVAKFKDKQHTMEGKPERITETRSPAEIVRALQAKGVLELDPGDVVEEA